MPPAIPARIGTPWAKSLVTMNTGNLSWRSRLYGLVEPAKSTVLLVNVNCPNVGTATPLPCLSCLAIYSPNAAQMVASTGLEPTKLRRRAPRWAWLWSASRVLCGLSDALCFIPLTLSFAVLGLTRRPADRVSAPDAPPPPGLYL